MSIITALAVALSDAPPPLQRDLAATKKRTPNHKKPCFNPGCRNHRNGNGLYCSSQCSRDHRAMREQS